MNPIMGVLFHWLGGLASASFYIPYRGVKRWSWETMWLVGGVFSWIIAPAVLALILVPNAYGAIFEAMKADPSVIFWAYFWGAMWGFGGLTFGLTMRYLGIGLGMAVALSYCTVFGQLMPPIFNWFMGKEGGIVDLAIAAPGQLILLGLIITVVGICVTGMAGMSKERELVGDAKQAIVKEFNFRKGMLVATFSGIMSASFSYGLTAGSPIKDVAHGYLVAAEKSDLWSNLPVLIVVLLGGFTTNCIWCLILNAKNKSGKEYFQATQVETTSEGTRSVNVPMVFNYLLAAAAGTCWYFQFFFYSMGEVRMGAYGQYSSWTLHMASIIIFSSIWGFILKEWKGTSHHSKSLVVVGIAILVIATVVIGYGSYFQMLLGSVQAAAGH